MADTVVPIEEGANQTLQATLPIDSKNVTLVFTFTFNEVAGYWTMKVADSTNNTLLDGVPLLLGSYPAANVLGQYAYLGIGSAYVVPASSQFTNDPGFHDLGSTSGVNYYLVWSDTPTN